MNGRLWAEGSTLRSTEDQGQGGPDTQLEPLKPLPCPFPGLPQDRCQPTVPQASPQVTSRGEGPTEALAHGGMPGMLGRTIWLLHKSCYGMFRARTKKEGSWWFGEKVQANRGKRG